MGWSHGTAGVPTFLQDGEHHHGMGAIVRRRSACSRLRLNWRSSSVNARGTLIDRALDCVAGYSIFNDVSARDYQKRTSQWMIGKSFDTFGPFGPALVTTDEIPNPHELELTLTLNDLERQHSNTRHMIFSIPLLIAYLSEVMTLEPGDVISTGTPAKINGEPGAPLFMSRVTRSIRTRRLAS
jgi:2-keto-4-pentenoate hydratase/2-oxohepta-3-ene-1,7-dioic acid hydratase in catechol pathway